MKAAITTQSVPVRLLAAVLTVLAVPVAAAQQQNAASTLDFECPESVSGTAGLPDYPLMDTTPQLRRYRIAAPDGWSTYRTNNYSSVVYKRQGHSVENRFMNCFYGYAAKTGEDNGTVEMWFHSLHRPFPDGMNCLAAGGFTFHCSRPAP